MKSWNAAQSKREYPEDYEMCYLKSKGMMSLVSRERAFSLTADLKAL